MEKRGNKMTALGLTIDVAKRKYKKLDTTNIVLKDCQVYSRGIKRRGAGFRMRFNDYLRQFERSNLQINHGIRSEQ